jgi:hypothetical protein
LITFAASRVIGRALGGSLRCGELAAGANASATTSICNAALQPTAADAGRYITAGIMIVRPDTVTTPPIIV